MIWMLIFVTSPLEFLFLEGGGQHIYTIKRLHSELWGRDRMVVGFTTTYAISAYHHWCCELESRSGWGVQHYVIKFIVVVIFIPEVNRRTRENHLPVAQVTSKLYHIMLYTSPWSRFELTTPVVITEILLKVELKTIEQTNKSIGSLYRKTLVNSHAALR
jgi:hypothetical protein